MGQCRFLSHQLTFRVEALRALQEVGGADPVPPERFEAVVAAVKARLRPEVDEILERVQQLVEALQLPRH